MSPSPLGCPEGPPASGEPPASSTPVGQVGEVRSFSNIPPTDDGPNGTDAEAPKPKKQRKAITREAKVALKAFFNEKSWPLNKCLPRGKLEGELETIMKNHKLDKSQLSRQLANYKKEKFGHSTITLAHNTDMLKEKLASGIASTLDEFVSATLTSLAKPTVELNADFRNFAKVLNSLPESAREFVEATSNSPSCDHHKLLTSEVKGFIEIAADEFPRTLAKLSGSEMNFITRVRARQEEFIRKWGKEGKTSMSTLQFKALGSFLFNAIKLQWMYSAANSDKPEVCIPGPDDDTLVGKYSHRTVYYVAGWIVFSLSKAKTIASKKRGIYHRLAHQHSLSEDEAKAAMLPIGLVLRRKRRASMFCTEKFYRFISFVESVYVSNLTLDMMMAHADGDVIGEIKSQVLQSETAICKFTKVCNCTAADDEDAAEPFTEEEVKALLDYVMTRFANMRGAYFVKFLRGTQSSSAGKLAEAQATRTRLMGSVATSSTNATRGTKTEQTAESKEPVGESACREPINEEKLWSDVEESVLEHSKEVDGEEARFENILD